MAKNRIAMLRKEQRMNQRELGERLGVGQTTVSAWETGKNEPDNDSMNTMAQMFGVSIGYLVGYENDEITRGLTQEQIRARYEEKEREKEIAAYLKAKERERQGFSDEEIEEMVQQDMIVRWNKADPNHLMYFEAFQFNEMCDNMSQAQREAMLAAAQAVYRAVHSK